MPFSDKKNKNLIEKGAYPLPEYFWVFPDPLAPHPEKETTPECTPLTPAVKILATDM